MAALTLLDNIEPSHAGKLRQAGINSTRHLLEQCRTESDRVALTRLTGLPLPLIDNWIRLADLCRLRGVGREYAGLLSSSGVGTVLELALLDPVQLRQQMSSRNRDESYVKCLPSEQKVRHWVEEARRMVRIIGY